MIRQRSAIDISDDDPKVYVPAIKARFQNSEWDKMLELDALPEGRQELAYDDFLTWRRALMADVIRKGV